MMFGTSFINTVSNRTSGLYFFDQDGTKLSFWSVVVKVDSEFDKITPELAPKLKIALGEMIARKKDKTCSLLLHRIFSAVINIIMFSSWSSTIGYAERLHTRISQIPAPTRPASPLPAIAVPQRVLTPSPEQEEGSPPKIATRPEPLKGVASVALEISPPKPRVFTGDKQVFSQALKELVTGLRSCAENNNDQVALEFLDGEIVLESSISELKKALPGEKMTFDPMTKQFGLCKKKNANPLAQELFPYFLCSYLSNIEKMFEKKRDKSPYISYMNLTLIMNKHNKDPALAQIHTLVANINTMKLAEEAHIIHYIKTGSDVNREHAVEVLRELLATESSIVRLLKDAKKPLVLKKRPSKREKKIAASNKKIDEAISVATPFYEQLFSAVSQLDSKSSVEEVSSEVFNLLRNSNKVCLDYFKILGEAAREAECILSGMVKTAPAWTVPLFQRGPRIQILLEEFMRKTPERIVENLRDQEDRIIEVISMLNVEVAK